MGSYLRRLGQNRMPIQFNPDQVRDDLQQGTKREVHFVLLLVALAVAIFPFAAKEEKRERFMVWLVVKLCMLVVGYVAWFNTFPYGVEHIMSVLLLIGFFPEGWLWLLKTAQERLSAACAHSRLASSAPQAPKRQTRSRTPAPRGRSKSPGRRKKS